MTTAYPGYDGYPPTAGGLNPMFDYEAQNHRGSTTTVPDAAHKEGDALNRGLMRTPSPTPSEKAELARSGVLDWRAMKRWQFWIRREWLWYYVIIVIICVISVLMTLYHKQIVNWLKPAAEWMQNLKFGFLIPIAVLFVLSFPPLFGHEIVAVLCGLVWGLGWGFAIVAAGTFLGEVGNFYAFKYCCRARGEKLEQQEVSYACLAKIVRDGGFKIALIARLSAIPGHFTTAVFSTCGMGIVVFSLAAILSLPKQFITVYLGVVLEQAEEGHVDTKTHIINYSVIGITVAITVAAMWYMYREMNKVKPAVIYERRKRRQAKLIAAANASVNAANPNNPVYSASGINTQAAMDSTSSLTAFVGSENNGSIPMHQRWDTDGRAVGYASVPIIAQPTPVRRGQEPSFDAYADYGGRPVPTRRDTDDSVGTTESTDALVTPNAPGRGTQQHPQPQYAPPSIPPPPAQQPITRGSRQGSLEETPTQTQFANVASPQGGAGLVSPPLPTPSYGAPATQQGAFVIGGAGGSVSASGPPSATSESRYYPHFTTQPLQRQNSSVPPSPALGNPYGNSPAASGQAGFATQQQMQRQQSYSGSVVVAYSPSHSAAPSPAPRQHYSGPPSPAAPPSQPPPGYYAATAAATSLQPPGHGREETDGSFHTAPHGHSRPGTDISGHSYGAAF